MWGGGGAGVSTLAGGGGTYLGWGVPTLSGGTYLGWMVVHLGWTRTIDTESTLAWYKMQTLIN